MIILTINTRTCAGTLITVDGSNYRIIIIEQTNPLHLRFDVQCPSSGRSDQKTEIILNILLNRREAINTLEKEKEVTVSKGTNTIMSVSSDVCCLRSCAVWLYRYNADNGTCSGYVGWEAYQQVTAIALSLDFLNKAHGDCPVSIRHPLAVLSIQCNSVNGTRKMP